MLSLVQGEGVAAATLKDLGIARQQVKSRLAKVVDKEVPLEGLGTTAELKTAMEAACEAATYPDQVTAQDLLVALAETDGNAGAVLSTLGASDDVIRAGIDRANTQAD